MKSENGYREMPLFTCYLKTPNDCLRRLTRQTGKVPRAKINFDDFRVNQKDLAFAIPHERRRLHPQGINHYT